MKKSLQTLVFWPYWCKERHPTFNEICGHCLLPDGVQMKRWGTNNGIAHLCVSLVFMRYDVIKSIFMRDFLSTASETSTSVVPGNNSLSRSEWAIYTEHKHKYITHVFPPYLA